METEGDKIKENSRLDLKHYNAMAQLSMTQRWGDALRVFKLRTVAYLASSTLLIQLLPIVKQ